MPVLVDKGIAGCRIIAAPERIRARHWERRPPREWIRIGLFNNMPDAAIEATEQQFLTLLNGAAQDQWIHLQFFGLSGIPRTGRGRDLTRDYGTVADLANARLDGLIVTGTEPRAADLADEPYWKDLTRVVDWAERNTIATVWSCLASHAAVLYRDRIGRVPLGEKCFGVFDFDVIADHPMTIDLPSRLRVPHARFNGLSKDELLAAGYRVLTWSAEAGVDMFVREGNSLSVFLQGHPEYDGRSLLNEYRRDVGRFLRRERDVLPPLPRHYFEGPAGNAMTVFRQRALAERCDATFAGFPMVPEQSVSNAAWFATAAAIYRNWLGFISERKSRTPALHRDVGLAQTVQA